MEEQLDSQSSKLLGDGDVFEINDFTVITDFEVFILSLENVLHELTNEVEIQDKTLASDASCSNIQKIAQKEIVYENFKFKVDYFKQFKPLQIEEDIEVIHDTDCDEQSNYLCNNSKNFLDDNGSFREDSVVSRQYGVDSDFILLYTNERKYFSESVINMVQSALTVATANIYFDLPILFQFYPGASIGSMQNKNCCTTFEGCILNKCLNRHKTLDGAVEMFKQKIIALQYDFKKDLSDEVDNFHKSLSVDNGANCSHKFTLQRIDPSLIKGFCLSAVFIQSSYNDDSTDEFDLETAKFWKISFDFDDEFSYELSYTLTRFLEHKEEEYSNQTVKSLIPQSNTETKSMAASALGPLLDKPAVNFELVPKLEIFGDDDFSHEGLSGCLEFIMEEGNAFEFGGNDSNRDKLLRKLSLAKSAPPNSLTRRLSTCLLTRIDKNLVGFCRLWMKFVDILRHYWEYNMDLPGFEKDDKPDLSHCLLHQKLQMIQHCIFVRRSQHSDFESKQASGQEGLFKSLNHLPSIDDDEFFDAPDDFNAETPIKSDVPRGRSALLEPPQFLKNNPKERVYIPLTLNKGPMTEDQLNKHESYLLELEDSDLRNRAQSDLLLSDMQAFKAANPEAVLEDFLCWHSPRDLIDGELSDRMKLPGNLWQENWRMVRPIPASRQNRLFNETKEVEQDLTSSLRSIEEFLLKYSSIVNLLVEQAITTNISMELNSCVSSLVNNLCLPIKTSSKDELSLKNTLNNVLVPDLSECRVLEVLKSFFVNDDLMEPKRKQIILRTMVPRPGSGSRPMPQRMFVFLEFCHKNPILGTYHIKMMSLFYEVLSLLISHFRN
uniref:Rab3 GTPase-activating protein catalytic subunit n=1 Tax=Meloidogyne hapla TaxID=6305 RepID=A0A1I8BPB7_MELHA